MKINRIVLLSITLLHALSASFSQSLQVDLSRVQEHKADMARTSHHNRYLRGGIYGTVALIATFSIYNFFKEPPLSNEAIKKIYNIIFDETGNTTIGKMLQGKANPVGMWNWCKSTGSGVAKFFGNGILFVAQNVLLSAAASVAQRKSQRVLKFPGKIDWFVAYETPLNQLLRDYRVYAQVIPSAKNALQSEVDRALESITSQVESVIRSVEKVVAYIEYIQVRLGENAQQESDTIKEYIIQTTNEFAHMVTAETVQDNNALSNKIQQFASEMTSLFNRFLRLQRHRSVYKT